MDGGGSHESSTNAPCTKSSTEARVHLKVAELQFPLHKIFTSEFLTEKTTALFTIFIKIRAHRGKFLNEQADRWADEGQDDVGKVRWDGPRLAPSSHPTFSWTEAGVKHKCSMPKILQARVHLKVAKLQFLLHKNFTSEFLTETTTAGIFWEYTAKGKQCVFL